ncbi:peptidoglycan editing factor PgeF [Paenibacillus cymbidii]|uniref:peptidoglycan editing factor PgeF n=1 Tax=Paenibacillus cymbidii TaxID=1639034 RepID=UPI001080D5B2|nr:peptidoglycan editing factor PgeF [Paenibacillus cymbidii]
MEPFRPDKRGPAQTLTIADWPQRFPELTAGFTTRRGGFSAEPFAQLNCGLHVNDETNVVIANRRLVAEQTGIPFADWVYGEQVHGRSVAVVTSADRGKGTVSREDALADTDAFATNERGLGLAAMYADCVPLYFVDPVHHAVGLAHAGWKGTMQRIAEATVQAMSGAFGSVPGDLYAAIGPSVGVCCYEVDDAVMENMVPLIESFGLSDDSAAFITLGSGKYKLNLQECNRQIMIKAGILPHRIEISKWCTSCNVDRFFSHRKEQGRTGRMIAWIGWER